jgi:hypothetical protein
MHPLIKTLIRIIKIYSNNKHYKASILLGDQLMIILIINSAMKIILLLNKINLKIKILMIKKLRWKEKLYINYLLKKYIYIYKFIYIYKYI